MEYRKYMHIERIGRSEVEGILDGTVYIYPKIDGTNAVVFLGDDGNVHAGSRKQELNYKEGLDNQGFMSSIIEDTRIKSYLLDHPTHYIYGEWLVKHSIGYYKSDSWRKFYIFDIFDKATNKYIPYEEYKENLEKYGITNIIPLMAKLINPSKEDIEKLLPDNKYLIADNEVRFGEGVVIKNYDFVNTYGRTVFAKIVASEFLNNKKENRVKNHLAKTTDDINQKIVNSFLTDEVIEKEYQKLLEEVNPTDNRNKFIRMLLNRIWHEFLVEEIAEIDKKYKHPTLDLKALRYEVEQKIKTVKKDIF